MNVIPHDIELKIVSKDGIFVMGKLKWESIQTLKENHDIDMLEETYKILLSELDVAVQTSKN